MYVSGSSLSMARNRHRPLTCVIVAETSLGAEYRKSVMRIMGAILGGLLAYVFIIVLEPALETIAGFMLSIAPVMWLSAWVGSGSPRIAYVGTQIGFAFAHAVLPGYGPVTDLESALDRVLGILLGITVVGFIDYVIWPQRSERMITKKLAVSMRTLGKLLGEGMVLPHDQRPSAAMLQSVDTSLQSAQTFLEHAQIEPGSNQADASSRLNTMGLMTGTLHTITRRVQARYPYHVGKQFTDQLGPFIELQAALDHSCSQALLGFADRLENKPNDYQLSKQSSDQMLEALTRQAILVNASNADEAHWTNAHIDLDKFLIDAIDELGSMLASIESH